MLSQKVCIVTGANAGIGKATALELAKMNADLVLICRNQQKAELAKQDVIHKSGNQHVTTLTADFSSLQSVRNAAEQFRATYNQLHVLINNAGAFYSHFGYTEDRMERQFGVNHLAPFLLTNLLLDMLRASAPSRIINVASDAHYKGAIHFDDLHLENHYNGLKAYAQSKLANVLFTKELHNRLEGTGVTANALHPGVVSTGIGQKHSKLIHNIAWGVGRLFMTTTQKGAETPVYLASSPEVEGVSGKYFENNQEVEPSDEARDLEKAKRLWDVSEQLTGLNN